MSEADPHHLQDARLVALISVPARLSPALGDETGGDEAGDALPDIGGRPLASHQLDFALSCGASHIVVIGDGASEAALGLRHKTEAAGHHFSIVSGPHSLAGIISDNDGVLVMQPGLFAQSEAALKAIQAADGERVLTLASGAGTTAGFERIDLERAWAGLLLVDGQRMEQLLDLPEDCDPFPALLRIALQARLREVQLRDKVLSNGSWIKIRPDTDMAALDKLWLARQLPTAAKFSPCDTLSRQILFRCKAWLLPSAKSRLPLLIGAGVMAAASLATAWLGYSYVSFLGVAITALIAGLFALVARTDHGRFAVQTKPKWRRILPHLGVDSLLFACCWLALGNAGLPYAPLLLFLGLNSTGLTRLSQKFGVLTDRFAIALVLAIVVNFGLLGIIASLIGVLLWSVSLIWGEDEGEIAQKEPDQG